MNYLIDTNVISELAKEKPSPMVVKKLSTMSSTSLYLSVLTWGELRKGIERLPQSPKKNQLQSWLEKDLPHWFGDRILSINTDVADRWGRLLGEMNRTVPAIDSLIAATALHYDTAIVTRNTKDFDYPDLIVINPFE